MINFDFSNCPEVPACYKMWINKDLAYVGKAKNLKNRLTQHQKEVCSGKVSKDNGWRKLITHISCIPCANELEADIVETIIINSDLPLFNVDKKYDCSITFPFKIPEEYILYGDLSDNLNLPVLNIDKPTQILEPFNDLFNLDTDQWLKFISELESPSKSNEQLRDLLISKLDTLKMSCVLQGYLENNTDVPDKPDFFNAIELSGLSELDFIKKAIEEKILRVFRETELKNKKINRAGEDFTSLKALKGKHSAYLRLKSVLKEILGYNSKKNPEKRIFISKSLLSSVTGANSRSLKTFMVTEKNEIDKINNFFDLHSPKNNRLNIKEFQEYLNTK